VQIRFRFSTAVAFESPSLRNVATLLKPKRTLEFAMIDLWYINNRLTATDHINYVPQKEHERVSETGVFPSPDRVSGTLCMSHLTCTV